MAKDQKKKRKEKDKERLSEQEITTKRKINKKNKKKNDNAGLGLQDNGASKLITDERFSSVHSDPRFQNVPKKQSKVHIDSRFQRMFSDKAFSSSSRLDKRGKPICQTKPNPLLHYYSHEQDEEPDSNLGLQRRGVRRSLDSTSSESELSDEDGAVAEEGVDDDSDSDTTTTDEDEGIYLEDDHSEKEDLPLIEHETRRLAIVDMDWNHVKAADLYVLMSSFLPKGGQILSVAVYPSDFGLKRMEEEAVHGPTGIFDSDEDHSEDDDAEVDEEKLRAYEKSRLKYYYAVVECDSIATADYLYKTCDGVEFERTSNVLDLRFISDSVEFKHPPRDVATEAPTSYEGLDFHTRALQHSKIDLSWDEDEPHRTKSLKRKFNPNQLAEMEFKEFLASDDGETDDDENDEAVALPDSQSKTLNKRELYRALIQSGDGSDEDTNADKDMEVTFNTGLEDISKRILERQKDKKSETVWEAYLRKRSEKKKVRKKGSKFSSSDENSSDSDQEAATEEPDDFFIEEALGTDVKSNAKTSTKKNLKERKQPSRISEEQEASRAELELLLADEQGTDRNLKGYNLKSKKLKGKKGKKEVVAEDKIPSVDYDDPRFSALFKSHLFALDPTDPQFKRSAAYARQLSQKQKKGDEEEAPEDVKTRLTREVPLLADDLPPKKDKHLQSSDISSKKEKHELSSLVRSVKRKVGTIQS